MPPVTFDSLDLHICHFLIMYICPVGVTKHTQWWGGDRHRSHRGESSQEEHQPLWTHDAAFDLVLRDAQVIPLLEQILLPLWLFFLNGFYSFSQCLWFRIDYSDLSVWVVYLWPSDPSRVCFCHSTTDSLHKVQGSPSPQFSIISRLQKLVGWINNRAASYHIQPDIYCLLAGFVNLRPQI